MARAVLGAGRTDFDRRRGERPRFVLGRRPRDGRRHLFGTRAGVNDVFREAAARHPDVTYVDAYTLFSAPDGTFASMLPVPGGKVARVRGADGIHLTPEGGDLLAETVFERLDPACRITEQAVPGAAKATIEARGARPCPGRGEARLRRRRGRRRAIPAVSGQEVGRVGPSFAPVGSLGRRQRGWKRPRKPSTPPPSSPRLPPSTWLGARPRTGASPSPSSIGTRSWPTTSRTPPAPSRGAA
jgi:hypothetical protein